MLVQEKFLKGQFLLQLSLLKVRLQTEEKLKSCELESQISSLLWHPTTPIPHP